MNTILIFIFSIIVVLAFWKTTQLLILLTQLGFNGSIVWFLCIVYGVAGLSIYMVLEGKFATSMLVIASILLGMFLPALFDATKKKPKSHYGKKKPKSVSDTDYAWSHYGGGSSDCGDVGSSSDGGGDGGGCD